MKILPQAPLSCSIKQNLLICLCLLSFCVLIGCGVFGNPKAPEVSKSYLKNEKKIEEAKDAVATATEKVEQKGKTLLHGVKYTLALETNKTPTVIISSRLVDLAQLSIGLPSVAEAVKIEEIVDGLLSHYKSLALKLEVENLNLVKENSVLSSNNAANSAVFDTRIKQLIKDSEALEKKAVAAEKDLKRFETEIILLQEKEVVLKATYEGKLAGMEEINRENSGKAELFDEQNSFWNSINPLKDLFNFFKKLVTLSIICGVLFLALKVLEVFFPALSILSAVGSMVVGIFKKIVPAAFSGAGMISSKVMDTLKQVVSAQNNIFNKLRDLPLEDELIENYPSDYKFSKEEVKKLLLSLTDNTVKAMEDELRAATDETSRGVITMVKQELRGDKRVTSLI